LRGERREQSTHQTARSAARGTQVLVPGLVARRSGVLYRRTRLLLRSLGCGTALGWAAFSACANFQTPLQPWAVPFAIGIVILSAVELWTAAFAACLIWTVQLLQFQAEMGWLAGILSIVFLSLYAFGPGRACTVLIAPFLMPMGLAAAAPLGLGLALGRKSGWFWAALAYAWTAAHAFLFGQWRLGVARGRLWEIVAEKASCQPQGFNSAWVRSIVGNLEFTRLKSKRMTSPQTVRSGRPCCSNGSSGSSPPGAWGISIPPSGPPIARPWNIWQKPAAHRFPKSKRNPCTASCPARSPSER
jgi:hypothetical protein